MKTHGSGESNFIEIYKPADGSELIMIKTVLEREGVIYYVNNELATLGGIHPVPGGVRVMVQADRAEESKRLLQEELGLK
jgi:hypothetical protein